MADKQYSSANTGNADKSSANGSSAKSRGAPKRLRRLAFLLDSAIPLPGGRSIGLDAVLGLIPGIGDVAGALASIYIVGEGVKMGAPKSVVTRMVGNVLLESTVGVVPVIGDLFDMVYKSNMRNIKLLEALEHNPAKTAKSSRLVFLLMLAVAACFLIFIIWMVYRFILFVGSAILHLIT